MDCILGDFDPTSVRILMILSPLVPEIRDQSSGLVVLGRSSFFKFILYGVEQIDQLDALLLHCEIPF
jgi:hypothetical protein